MKKNEKKKTLRSKLLNALKEEAKVTHALYKQSWHVSEGEDVYSECKNMARILFPSKRFLHSLFYELTNKDLKLFLRILKGFNKKFSIQKTLV